MRSLLLRALTSAVVALACLAFAAGPAAAHEEITPKTAVVGKPTFFQLSAANEKKVGLTKITLHAPANLPFGATTNSPPGWHADVTPSTIIWTGGTVAPDAFETWGFEIEGADQAATYTYKVDLGFADSSSQSVDVPITAVADGPTPTTSGTGTTPSSAGGPSTSIPTATTAAANTNASKSSDGTARTLGILALVVSLLALLLAAARRSRPASSAAATPTEQGNDW